MYTRASRVSKVMGLVLVAGLAFSARADLPAALDRVPADAAVVAAIKDLESFHTQFEKLTKSLGITDTGPLGMAGALLKTPGLNAKGSAAIVMLKPPAPPQGDEMAQAEPPIVMVVPVSNYAELTKSLGGEGNTIKVGDQSMHIKDLGGGFAALSPQEEVLEGFKGEAGQKAAHAKTLGANGQRISDASDTVIIANVEALGPVLKDGVKQMEGTLGMMAMMAGPQGAQLAAQQDLIKLVANSWIRDASVGVLGIGLSEKGVSLDIGTQFKDGSEVGKFFTAKGKASALTTRVPSDQFLIAGSVDTSAAGIRQIVKNMASMQEAAAKKAAEAAKAEGGKAVEPMLPPDTMKVFSDQIDSTSGLTFMMGSSPALFQTGLFSRTVMYVQTEKPAEYAASMKKMYEDFNGKQVEGMTYETSYKPGAQEVEGAKVDSWSMAMKADPNDPNAQMAMSMMSQLMGPGGKLGGFVAPAQGGVVMTMSENTPLLSSALKAAKDGSGLGASADLKAVAANLPSDRTFEAFIGTKSILDLASGFLMMMGGGGEMKIPEKVSPVAIGGTTHDQGVQVRLFVPTDVITTVSGIVKSMSQGEEGEPGEPAPAEEGKAPSF
ncbi:MAG: hypothetical protein SFY95_03075 [Planctomycetota bacterium]|nr:hypothetical protein [Planctomycetota bacterium]